MMKTRRMMVTLSTAGKEKSRNTKDLLKAEILVYEWPFHLGILRFFWRTKRV